MQTPNANPRDPARYLAGIKTAALIVIIGAVAVAADQAFFVGPNSRAPEASPPPAVVSSVQIDGFALPDHLRQPTAADAQPAAPTF